MNVYHMFNPKITEIQLDELDHSVGTEGTEVGISFTYDALNMVTSASFDPNVDEYDIQGLEVSAGAKWPLRYVDHPNNPPPKNLGLRKDLENAAAKFSSFSGPEFLEGFGDAASSFASGPTLDSLTRNAPFQLPGVGELQAQVESIAGGLSASIPNLSEVATNAFSNNQFIARAQQQLTDLGTAQLAGATEFVIDGATKEIKAASQILQGKLLKGIDLANNGKIDALRVSLIDRAAGVVETGAKSLLDKL